jgi:enoyl-CoA hydratase/carnithine racemase
MNYETILFTVEDHIATITLNRPEKLNAWNDTMMTELGHAISNCDRDDDIRAAVVTGSGRAFCAGYDLSAGEEAFKSDSIKESESLKEDARLNHGYAGPFPWQIRKPVFAAINGHAIGVGITYPMTCDVRIVAEDAKIQFAFVRRGVLPELWSHKIVPQIAGLSNAADLLLTGRIIRGRELADMGLASTALPHDQVLEFTMERAREVLLAAPVSVAISKQLLWKGLNASFFDLGPEESRLFEWLSSKADAREGVASFLQKREPQWNLRVSGEVPEIKL